MMTNLFSSFDPLSSVMGLSLNWTSTFLGLLFLPYLFWAMPSRWSLLWSSVMSTLHKEFKILLGTHNTGGTIIFVSLASFIVFNNFLGLLPYVFTSTSHLAMTLSLALPLWVSFMIFGWFNHTQHMFAHLVPLGTPGALMPFMVLIETVSNIIRPGTLAVRLAANMIAGHLLLTLLGNTGPSLTLFLLNFLIISQVLLLLLESAVAIIQSYVFAVLSTLYAGEVN
uniref:ATP synthase subunit a n=1 Tax=Rimicaris leurokolos TaxID=3457525 RepID=A0A343VVJ9_9EUCA|nr:ATP synthase F0 subunit 6 [Shinkaicaris leurokolos]AVP74664.1 ATP synthase F0 subunit 6 [Shinkaicaris leurokolos]WPN85854.1 ATP synthase F0 subunit 6 [Shinkaicaris leurokolos]